MYDVFYIIITIFIQILLIKKFTSINSANTVKFCIYYTKLTASTPFTLVRFKNKKPYQRERCHLQAPSTPAAVVHEVDTGAAVRKSWEVLHVGGGDELAA